MNTNTIEMTVQIPSGFGMPVCGHAYFPGSAGFSTTSVVREKATAVKGDLGLIATAYMAGTRQGTRAWSPPLS